MDKKEVDYTPKTIDPRSTELSQARRVVDANPHLKFSKGLGWMWWDGGRWKQGADGLIAEAVRNAADSATITYPSFGARFASRRSMDDVKAVCEQLTLVDPSELDTHKDWIHAGGTTWSMEYGATWDTALTELNTKSLPYEAGGDCPTWMQFLDDCFPGEADMHKYLQRLVGYGITGHTREHIFVLMQGRGRNGKSTFINVLTHVFDDYVRHIPVKILMDGSQRDGEAASPMLLQMRGARLVFTTETERGGRLDEPMVKQLTGGDTITARALRRDPVSFTPEALIWMATNYNPDIRGTDDGIWNRVKLIEWNESFAGREDRTIEERMKEEAPGILAWALEGAMEWYERGLEQPQRVKDATDHFRAQSDFLGSFVGDWLVKDSGAKLPRSEVCNIWGEFQEANGDRESLRSMRTLYTALRERGFEEYILDGVRGFRARRAKC